jgi:hypothetical protein
VTKNPPRVGSTLTRGTSLYKRQTHKEGGWIKTKVP